MIQFVQLRRIKKHAAFTVTHKRAVFPRIPQPLHHIDIFFRNLITQRVFRMIFAEIFRGTGQR